MTAATKPKPAAEEETKGLGLSPPAVAGGALASVTSTIAASTLGTAGTLWGAAAGSVISTVAAALYTHSLKRTAAKVTKVIPVGSGAVVVREETVRDATRAMPAQPPAPGKDLPAHLDPRTSKSGRFDIQLNRKFWLRVALFAVGMFLAVMAVITGLELLTQKPVASLVGNTETSRSTTLGTVTHTTPDTSTVPEDEQQEDTPVTTTDEAPRPDDEGAEQSSAPQPETTEENESGGQDIQRTAESTAGNSDEAEVEVDEAPEDTTQAPASTTAAPEPTTQADSGQ